MIRLACSGDVPEIVLLAEALRLAARQPQDLDRGRAASALDAMIEGGGVWVVEIDGSLRGFLAASIGASIISAQPVAWESGWYCTAPGWGDRLRKRFEEWARGRGCRFARMSAPPGSGAQRQLEADGYAAVEVAMVKAL